MDLSDFLDRYSNEVYEARDPEAARRFIADPCLRHESGELITMSLDDNVARVRGFIEAYPNYRFENRCVVAADDNLVSCYDLDLGDGNTLSGIEVFCIRDGVIAETWNSHPTPGLWG